MNSSTSISTQQLLSRPVQPDSDPYFALHFAVVSLKLDTRPSFACDGNIIGKQKWSLKSMEHRIGMPVLTSDSIQKDDLKEHSYLTKCQKRI
jgi:hypothetical protein